jgi:hypothetical protein
MDFFLTCWYGGACRGSQLPGPLLQPREGRSQQDESLPASEVRFYRFERRL